MILDTNAVSAIVNRDANARRLANAADLLCLPVIVFGEFEYGLLGSNKVKDLRPKFDYLIGASIPLPVDWDTGKVYASLKHKQRLIGRPIPENDLWIAALALQHDQPILSRDAHFDAIDGVRRVGW
jgi:tRNA(fMet)-specific endonuclease VapC